MHVSLNLPDQSGQFQLSFVFKAYVRLRFSVGDRRLTAVKMKCIYPLSRIEIFMDSFCDSQFFTTLHCNR